MGLIGLIPAAGQAKRLPLLPCSKEIFPIGTMSQIISGRNEILPKPIIYYLIEQLKSAGTSNTIIIINKEKWDLCRLLGSGKEFDINISYLIQEEKRGMPDALNLAYPWVKDSTILFGMPDTIFSPSNAFSLLLEKFQKSRADLTLGLFPTDKPNKFGMVKFEESEEFIYTVDKPVSTDLEFMWGIACWNNTFTELLHKSVSEHRTKNELVLGTIFQEAKDTGLLVNVIPFYNGSYIDIGTPEDLTYAMQSLRNSV